MVGRESAPLIPVGCGLCPCSSGFLSGRSCGFRSAWRPRLSSRPWLLRVSTGVVFASVRPTHVSAAAERVRRWLCSQGQPIRRGVERDLWSDLKLIQTGGFWLRLYGEIGRTSRRDRSYFASRSVLCGVSGRLRRRGAWVSASSVVVPGGVVLGAGVRVSRAGQSWGWGSCESGWTVVGRLYWCLRVPGVVGVAHSRMLRVGGNRVIMRNGNVGSGHNPAPMCADPPHCAWEPDPRIRRSPENPVIPTKTSPGPAEVPVSHVQHRRHPRPPSTVPDVPTHHNLEPELDRSRRGSGPISRRKWTDLEAEADRSRRGIRPISAKGGQ